MPMPTPGRAHRRANARLASGTASRTTDPGQYSRPSGRRSFGYRTPRPRRASSPASLRASPGRSSSPGSRSPGAWGCCRRR